MNDYITINNNRNDIIKGRLGKKLYLSGLNLKDLSDIDDIKKLEDLNELILR